MSEIGRNFNKAFNIGRQAFSENVSQHENPYRARNSRTAWKLGYEKAMREETEYHFPTET